MNEQERFEAFTSDLAALSKKYGIAIRSTGGVHIFENASDAENIVYGVDHTSGDLEFLTNQE